MEYYDECGQENQRAHPDRNKAIPEHIASSGTTMTEYGNMLTVMEEYVTQLKALIGGMSLADEAARRKFAVELHENVAQMAALAKIKLSALSKSASEEGLKRALNEIQSLLDAIMASLRTLTFEMSSPLLYELGFVPALEWLTGHIQEEYNMVGDFRSGNCPTPLDMQMRIVLFRIIRDLLIEVALQSKASKFILSLNHNGSELCVDIQDDGMGIDIAQIGAVSGLGDGLGYIAIGESIELLGGKIAIGSIAGGGTHIVISVPLRDEND